MTTGRINQVAQGHAGRANKRAKPTSPAYDARREPTTQIACSTANTLTKHAHARDADSPMRTCRWCFRRRPAFRKFLRNAKSTSRITPTTAHAANPRRRKHGRPTCAGRFSNNQHRPTTRVRPTDEASNQASTRELSPRSVAEAHRHRPANATSDAAHSLAARQRIPMSTPADRGATTNRRCGRISTAATPNRLNGWVATARTRAASFKLTRRSGCPEGNHSNRSQNRCPYPAAPQRAPEGAFSETSVRDWTTDQTHDQRTSRSVGM